MPDISVKCGRCSRREKKEVLAQFKLMLPRTVETIPPEVVSCANLQCYARLCDINLPYTLVSGDGDIQIKCWRCGEITHIQIEGILNVA